MELVLGLVLGLEVEVLLLKLRSDMVKPFQDRESKRLLRREHTKLMKMTELIYLPYCCKCWLKSINVLWWKDS
jgi:hypothetical protein